MSSALSAPASSTALAAKEPQAQPSRWARFAMVASSALGIGAVASGHPGWLAVALLPGMIGALFIAKGALAKHGLLFGVPVPVDPKRASIGLGVSIGRGAQVAPGAIVEMGADVGEDAIIESGAVVRMGASIHAGAVIEAGAVVSWGADVKRGARVCAGARVGAGATVGANAVVPADTWVMPGGDWHGGEARDGAALEANNAHPAEAKQQRADAPIDPRQTRLDAVFARIDAELALSPAQVREHLGPSVSGVRGMKETCKSLLERERNLRAEAAPEALAQLAAEKDALGKRIAGTDDDQVKLSLGSAVAAIEEQIRQRQLLARSADRLDAELTRLFWTLDALAAQLVRMRSAGTEAAVAPDAALEKSVQELQGEIDAIADALEQVASEDRRASAPMAAELGSAPPGGSATKGSTGEGKKVRG